MAPGRPRLKRWPRLLVGIIVAVVVACAGGPDRRIPTSSEARTELVRLVGLAQRGDFDALCRMADGQTSPNCVAILDGAGRDVPGAAPVIVAERTIEPDEGTAGGRVLTLCGHADDGSPYESEMLIFYDSGRLEVIQPIWWSGAKIQSASGGPAASASTVGASHQDCP